MLSVLCVLSAGVASPSPTLAQDAEVEIQAMAAGASAGSHCRMQYHGRQPGISRPPPYVVDAPLPSIFCEGAAKWVFVYETADAIQFYTLDPGKRESYRGVFRAAASGDIAPWAMRTTMSGEPAYFVNVNPTVDGTFDYAVAPASFDICAELAARPRIRTVAAYDANECSASLAGAYTAE